jgi:thioesterase domain-containing protein
VPIREEGAQPPFFCVHGAGGNVLNFRDLAKYLGGDQPFYGLQARGVEGKRAPHERIEDMAAEYVEAIRAVQPEGPYRIGGYSAGGVVAFEMAHRLRAQGETVALLALLDTFCPTLHDRPSKSFFEKLRDHVRGIAEHGWDYGRRYTRDRFNFEQNRLRRMQVALYEKLGKRLPIELRDIPMVDAYFEAVSGYALTFYPGKIALFTARDKGHVYDHVPHHMGWEELAGELEVHKVPGTHDNLMQEPNVKVLVDRLKEELEQSATQDLVS